MKRINQHYFRDNPSKVDESPTMSVSGLSYIRNFNVPLEMPYAFSISYEHPNYTTYTYNYNRRSLYMYTVSQRIITIHNSLIDMFMVDDPQHFYKVLQLTDENIYDYHRYKSLGMIIEYFQYSNTYL